MSKILILGGYGNFGKRISTALAKAQIAIVIAGREENKAVELQKKLQEKYPATTVEISIFDVKTQLSNKLNEIKPSVVINTVGPFQNSDYSIAKTCIKHSIDYIDLSDGRDFVGNFTSLDDEAKKAGVALITGASTVPGLSSAVLEKYKNEFSQIDSMVFGIAPGQKAERGLATTKAILSYIGKPLKPFNNSNQKRYGWQDLYCVKYPEVGTRLMANCDIPDLDLLPKHYNLKSIQFSAGMENPVLHLGIWILSWMVRLNLAANLQKHAALLLKLSHLFDILGTSDGGMHVFLEGKDHNNKPKSIKWFIIAKNGDGPQIPTIPTIILAKKLISKELQKTGAMPCVGMVSLEEYLAELKDFDVQQSVSC